jgi:hypothetical protein
MPAPSENRRSRVAILGALVAALAAVVAFELWPAAAPGRGPSNHPGEQRRPAPAAGTPAQGGQLAVKLDELKRPPPAPVADSRNPFRFYVKPPPPPPPMTQAPAKRVGPDAPPAPPVEQGPPPIPLKFIGTVEQGKKKAAIFSDGRGVPVYASEGELVLGQYRLVRIGVESVVMEYPDGRGRQTIPMRGQ